MRLILVHGRDQQGKDSQALRKVWTDALNRGLATAALPDIHQHEVVFPYYGDELAELVESISNEPAGGVSTKGVAQVDDADLDDVQLALLREMLPPAEIDAEVQSQAINKGMQNTAVAHAIARVADRSRFGPRILANRTKDVSLYLTHQVVAKRINNVIAAAIGDQPCVVVAHSLGSIVAYRVLRELGASAQVGGLITVGSPLGLNTVRTMLSPPARAFPEGVKSWVNAYDQADIVALHPLDSETWPVKPAITNHSSVKNRTDNRHGIDGYLDDPTVARAVHEALNAS